MADRGVLSRERMAGTDPDTMPVAAAVLDALLHPVLLIGEGNRILYANQASEDFFAASTANIRRRTLDYFLPFGSPVLSLADQVRMENINIHEYHIDVSSPRLGSERSEKWVDIYASPAADLPGRVVVQFLRRSMAEKFDRQLTHRGAARTVTGLASMLAHEIKNPLSGIRGAAQLLEMSASDDDRSLTRLIREETDRIVGLVDRMEVFSDERPVTREPVNIHAVLEHVRRLAENGFAKGIRFVDRYDPSLPQVNGNRDQLVQIFLNLVKNAAEALEGIAHPEITLSTGFRPGIHLSVPGGGERVALPIELGVADNGPGIPPDLRPYIFDPFITGKANGSGLGLALVAKIVGSHGGMIECDTTAAGSLFRILLPVYRVAGEDSRKARAEPA